MRDVLELLLLRRGQVVLRTDELVAHVARLSGPRGDDGRLAADGRAQLLRLRALHLDRRLRLCDLLRDPVILLADVVQVLDLVDRVLDVRRAEDHVERRRLVGLVYVDEPLPEHVHRCRVLALEEHESLRLEREQRVQRVEPLLVEREVGLHRLQPQRDVPHAPLERADASGVVGDLATQALLALLLRGDLRVERGDPRLDLLPLRDVVAERRSGEDEQDEHCER